MHEKLGSNLTKKRQSKKRKESKTSISNVNDNEEIDQTLLDSLDNNSDDQSIQNDENINKSKYDNNKKYKILGEVRSKKM